MKRFAIPPLLCLATLSLAQEQMERHSYDATVEQLQKKQAEWKKQSEGNTDVLLLDYVKADRKAKRVDVLGCATGVGGSDPVEFFLATHSSGKDYESLTITWAKPSDIHKALEFIGVKPGRPVNYETNHQWARGPRVTMTLDTGGNELRVEDCVIDTDTNTPLPRMGLIFAGSFTHTDETGKKFYAADEVDSKAIAPNYNDPIAVFDVPRRASQAAVYGFQRPNPKHPMKAGQTLGIILQPATGDEAVTSRDIVIETRLVEGKPQYAITEPSRAEGKRLAEAPTLPHLVGALAPLLDGKTDLFTTATIDPAMSITDVRKLFAVLMSLEQDRGVKLDPPAKGELFHRAFFPDEIWRNRQERLGEPWELFLTRVDGKIVARLERLVEKFEGESEPKKELQKFEVGSPEAFVKVINDNESQWSKAVFIYPPADATYGEIATWARPALPTYPRIFVFPPADAPTTQPVP